MTRFWNRGKLAVATRIIDYLQRHQHPGLHEWSKVHRPRLSAFHNRHRGEDCFIIGNGPSLNRMDLPRLNRFSLFGMNKIHLLFERQPLELSYHVCVNPFVIEQSLDAFRGLGCPSFLAFQNCPAEIQRGEEFQLIYSAGAPVCFRETILEPLNEGWTVTFVALQIAYFMGFQRVFLVGVDHNFQSTGKPNEVQTLETEDENHFDRRYFAGQQWQLPDLEGSELAYRMAKFFFERDGRRVFDATVGGKLQVFPKIPIDDAFAEARVKVSR
ncbi:MAG: 6-hydroxymethylpterin diphosphokinase MptE-like protein [Planctomycetota bacterium]